MSHRVVFDDHPAWVSRLFESASLGRLPGEYDLLGPQCGPSRSCSYSCHVTLSTPTAAVFFNWKKASDKLPSLTWCSKAVNLSLPSFRAASRTPANPHDLRFSRLCVRRKVSWSMFLLAGPLSSGNSADGSAPPLFAAFAGTMDPSAMNQELLPSAFTSAVPPVAFADRSDSSPDALGISRFSRLKFPDMLRVFDSAVPLHRLP